ncbi:hypothetical protein X474_02620 [Dethiosulfatarculus sandiegensis]|uniref:Uncharacterized protein n=1 Tax=Dethiosulfatarculus sandiegensis TaxID=1429043 RepID=A0A0D2JC49_9BACT|nr:hypothetical protein X474_02620 [Dethiosulfatarculus sandiegensis]
MTARAAPELKISAISYFLSQLNLARPAICLRAAHLILAKAISRGRP